MNVNEDFKSAHTSLTGPVTPRYSPQSIHTDGERLNLDKVRLLQKLFGLTISDIARAGNVSRPYVSRALSGSLVPSSAFFRRLEGNLGRLVEERASQFFFVTVNDCGGLVEEVLAWGGVCEG